MKFVITMNMSSMNGNPAHQMTVEHESSSLQEFSKVLDCEMFPIVRLWYRYKDDTGTRVWDDKGKIIINSTHVGKVQEYNEEQERS
jgi:hypothetical protein